MTRRPYARLTDVARAAGVSLSTASRALAEPDLVLPATRSRIQDAVARLGYVPHGAARALASRRSRTIGAVVPTLENPIFATSIQTLHQRIASAGYTLLVGSHGYDLDAEVQVVSALVERGVDGVLLVGLDHSPELYRLLAKAAIPFEITWATDPSRIHYSLGFSNRLAAASVAQHLMELRHREFAMISGETTSNDRARERVAGVREALAAHGLELPAHRVLEIPFSIAAARAALGRLLDAGERFTALVCGNDVLALGALLEAAARGIAVPHQLSVTGFDDIELASEFSPALTTIHLPVADIGHIAAERMLTRIGGGEVPRLHEIPVHLVVRASTAPPPRINERVRNSTKSGGRLPSRAAVRTGRR
ncbi:MAG: LacI family DNA-binding transcriptional regulator [Anaerolineae bacterium]|nr:LacI family DNA-binding transcriptional regulator [Anaerolineae bacterium]